MSFLENIAKAVTGFTGAVTGFTGLFDAASSLFNVLGGFFGNNSANPLDAGRVGSLLTQSTTPNNREDLRTPEQEETARLNQLFSVMRTEQGATPTT